MKKKLTKGPGSALPDAPQSVSAAINRLGIIRARMKALSAQSRKESERIATFGSCKNGNYLAYVTRAHERYINAHWSKSGDAVRLKPRKDK